MLKRLLFLVVALFLASGVVFSFHWLPPVQAHDPQNVELLYFIGEGVIAGVELEWRTATEYETAAFRMKRADSASGPSTYIDVWQNGQQISIVPLQNPGFPETGGTYIVLDMDATTGQTYWYTLIEIEQNGAEIPLETISVVAGLVQSPTPTGEVIGGGNTTPTTPTTPPTVTATQPAAASPTPLPTNTTTSPVATARTNTSSATSTSQATATNPANTNPNSGTGTGNGNGSSPVATLPTGGQPIAQITSTPAREAYPGTTGETTSLSPETTPETDLVYPEGQPTIPTEANETPYPLGEIPVETTGEGAYQGNSAPVVTDFGDSGEPGTSNNLPAPAISSSTTTANSTRGRIVLWVGFAAGLLIFAAGVFGTILLFTRKQNGPQ